MVTLVIPILCVTSACWLSRGRSTTSDCACAPGARENMVATVSSVKYKCRFIGASLRLAGNFWGRDWECPQTDCLDEERAGLLASQAAPPAGGDQVRSIGRSHGRSVRYRTSTRNFR